MLETLDTRTFKGLGFRVRAWGALRLGSLVLQPLYTLHKWVQGFGLGAQGSGLKTLEIRAQASGLIL